MIVMIKLNFCHFANDFMKVFLNIDFSMVCQDNFIQKEAGDKVQGYENSK